jgi:hypothetical protein
MLDFSRIKEIKLTDVLARYKIALRYKTDYAVCACPLPTHKRGDTSKSFSVNLRGNYFICFSDSCNANNGGKRGGDVINFVALMEGCREKDAALKLSVWYGIEETKTPTHMEQGRKQEPKTEMQGSNQNGSISGDSVKYMASIDAWFYDLVTVEAGENRDDYFNRILKAVKDKLVASYNAGKKAAK